MTAGVFAGPAVGIPGFVGIAKWYFGFTVVCAGLAAWGFASRPGFSAAGFVLLALAAAAGGVLLRRGRREMLRSQIWAWALAGVIAAYSLGSLVAGEADYGLRFYLGFAAGAVVVGVLNLITARVRE